MSMFRRSVDSVVSSEASASAVAPAGDSRTKEAKKQKLLRVVLVIMLVAIVSLTIAIIIVNFTRNSSHEPVPDEAGDSGSIQVDRMAEIKNYIRTLTVEEALPYLDEQITKYEGTEYDFEIKLIKIYVYINSGHYAEAMKSLDAIDPSTLSDLEKISLYEAYIVVYSGDEEEKQHYLDLRNAVYYDYFGEGGGGW